MSRIIEFDEFNVEKLDDELPLNEEVKVVEVKKRNFRKKLLLDPKTGVAKEVLAPKGKRVHDPEALKERMEKLRLAKIAKKEAKEAPKPPPPAPAFDMNQLREMIRSEFMTAKNIQPKQIEVEPVKKETKPRKPRKRVESQVAVPDKAIEVPRSFIPPVNMYDDPRYKIFGF